MSFMASKNKAKSESAVAGLEWIKVRFKEVGAKSKDLAEALQLPPSRISEKLNGKAEFLEDEIPTLASMLKMSIAEVLARLPYSAANSLVPDGFMVIKLCGAAKAGEWMRAIHIAEKDWGAVLIPKDAEYPYLSALRVTGDDMEKFYPLNSIAVFAPYDRYSKPIAEGDHVVVERSDGAGNREISIKELKLSKDGRGVLLIPHSNNSDYTPWELTRTDGNDSYFGNDAMKITGVVLKVMMDYKPQQTSQKNARKLPKAL